MNVVEELTKEQVDFERVPHRPAYTAQHLAHELHISGRDVAKTVLLRADNGAKYIVAVLPASKQLDLAKAARALGLDEVELATEFDIAKHCPDCELGVLPPFGSRHGMKTIVDSDLATEEFIWFDANTHQEAVRMKFSEFEKLEQPLVAPITQG